MPQFESVRDYEGLRHLFIEELGWDPARWSHGISMPRRGQQAVGFQNREQRSVAPYLRQDRYAVRALAQKGVWVVLHVTPLTRPTYPPYLERQRLALRLGRLFAYPIVVYQDGRGDQLWQWWDGPMSEPNTREHRVRDPREWAVLEGRLSAARFDWNDAADLSTADLATRIRNAFGYDRRRRTHRRSDFDPENFRRMGDALHSLALRAAQTPRLDREEESVYIAMVQEGSESALNRLFEANLYLALEYVRRAHSTWLLEACEAEDLFGPAALGLLQAIKRYDHATNVRLMAYSWYWMRQMTDREGFSSRCPIRIPMWVYNRWSKAAQRYDLLHDALCQNAVRVLPEAEADECLKLSPLDASTLRLMRRPPLDRCDDWEEAIDSEGGWSPWGPSPAPDSPDLDAMLATLRPRDAQVLRLRYGLAPDTPYSHTLDEVGTLLNITRERARQIESRAITLLAAGVLQSMSPP